VVTETRRPKPTTINVAEELGFHKNRMPDIGPGCHKPNMGRGGLALASEYYIPENDLKVPQKKGTGLADSPRERKPGDQSKPKWSEMI